MKERVEKALSKQMKVRIFTEFPKETCDKLNNEPFEGSACNELELMDLVKDLWQENQQLRARRTDQIKEEN